MPNKKGQSEEVPPFDIEKDLVFGEKAISFRPAESGCILPAEVMDVEMF